MSAESLSSVLTLLDIRSHCISNQTQLNDPNRFWKCIVIMIRFLTESHQHSEEQGQGNLLLTVLATNDK